MTEAVERIRELARKGITAERGAVAVRCRDACYITVNGADQKNLTETDLIVVRDDSDVSPEMMPKEYYLYLAIFETYPHVKVIFRSESEFIQTASEAGKKIRPMLDDMAQIVGVSVYCADQNVYEDARKIVRAVSCLKDRTALMIKNQGAVCIGSSFEEAEVSAIVFEKGCKTVIETSFLGGCKTVIETSFLGGGYYISPLECWLMHKVYQMKYSKQAEK